MPRKQSHFEGGKIKSLKSIGKDIQKGFKKNISKPLQDKIIKPATKKIFNPMIDNFEDIGMKMGKITNEKLLPGVVSTGIPLASNALGLLGAEFGIPPELTSSLSQNLLEEYIPKKYQTNNKYVDLFSNALNMGLSGNYDPNTLMQFGKDLTGAIGEDLGLNSPIPTNEAYNPDNPYQDLMLQLMKNHFPINLPQQINQPTKPIQQLQPIDDNPNDDLDARYQQSDLGQGADSIKITKPPYQQREGNIDGLLGGGIKKKRGRKPKKVIIEEEIEIYTKKKPSYKKFKHAKNSSLEQLLEAKEEKENKEAKKAFNEMVDKQKKYLSSMGFGLKKGSNEAKEWGRKMKEAREKKRKNLKK